MATIVVRVPIMKVAHDSFISSTYWRESVGPTAALATIGKMRQVAVSGHIQRIGTRLRDGLERLGLQHQVPVRLSGHSALLTIAFDDPNHAALSTLLTAGVGHTSYDAGFKR